MRGAIRRNKNQRPPRAVDVAEAGERSESATFGAMLDEFTTYQVEGSVVDYLAADG